MASRRRLSLWLLVQSSGMSSSSSMDLFTHSLQRSCPPIAATRADEPTKLFSTAAVAHPSSTGTSPRRQRPPPPPLPPQGIYLAPMVLGSELAMRMLARKRGGASLCYAPMCRAQDVLLAHSLWKEGPAASARGGGDDDTTINVPNLLKSADIDESTAAAEAVHICLSDSCPGDSHLVAQTCGSDPAELGRATSALLECYDRLHRNPLAGVDLNLGCPQQCADRGNFGAFLLERDPDAAIACLEAMRGAIDCYYSAIDAVPARLSCKIRLLDSDDDTIAFARRLQDAGCDLVAVHCRRRTDKHNGPPDYDMGRKVVAALDIPVVINGGILTANDAAHVAERTKCHAVMSARGYLANHRLLLATSQQLLADDTNTNPAEIAAEYLMFAERYPPPSSLYIQKHLRWIFRSELQPPDPNAPDYSDWRTRLWTFLVRPYLRTTEQFRLVIALYVKLKRDSLPATMEGEMMNCKSITIPESIHHLVEGASFKAIRSAGM